MVACGYVDSFSTFLMTEQGKPVPDGTVGVIWVPSSILASGYWGQEELTSGGIRWKIVGHRQLGEDCGRQIYETGRSKDIIIINGRNIFPVDIEHTIETIISSCHTSCDKRLWFDRIVI